MTQTAGIAVAPDQRGAPASEVAQLRLEAACEAFAFITSLSIAAEHAIQAASAMEDENEDRAREVRECAGVVQSLVSYVAARAGDVVAGRSASDVGSVGDLAPWLFPMQLQRLLHELDQRAAQ